MKNALVLGGGFSGCISSFLLKKAGFNVTVLEGAPHPGGGCWTRFYGGHPYTIGPRVFFTPDEEVFNLMTSLVELRHFYTKTWSFVEKDAQFYNYPLQFEDIVRMPDGADVKKEVAHRENKSPNVHDFESYWMSAIGPILYGKFVENYSKKMWNIESNKQLVANFEWVNRGTPIRNGDTRLYNDQYQGYPEDKNGFNTCFLKCLEGCDVRYGCEIIDFDVDKNTVRTKKGDFSADIIINTIYVDTLFGNMYGKLKYSGRIFFPLCLPTKNVFPDDLTWIHYSGSEPQTRVTEFKRITGFTSESTLLGIEIPADVNRLYPVQSVPELRRFEQYKELFPKNFYSIGRLGKFRYQGIADALRDAIDTVEAITR